jgi:AhpD family alkylhydroperoxidase
MFRVYSAACYGSFGPVNPSAEDRDQRLRCDCVRARDQDLADSPGAQPTGPESQVTGATFESFEPRRLRASVDVGRLAGDDEGSQYQSAWRRPRYHGGIFRDRPDGARAKALDAKTKGLIALGIGSAIRCDDCIAFHIKAALERGATREEIGETIGMSIYLGAGPCVMYASHAFAALQQFETERTTARVDLGVIVKATASYASASAGKRGSSINVTFGQMLDLPIPVHCSCPRCFSTPVRRLGSQLRSCRI